MPHLCANPPTGSSTEADQDFAYQSWAAACAKAGHPGAANIRFGGTSSEQKTNRAALRRAVNAISASIGTSSS